jgi:hypothetical protein
MGAMKYAIFLLLVASGFSQSPTDLKPWMEAAAQLNVAPPQIHPVLDLRKLPDVGPSARDILVSLPHLVSPLRRRSILRNFASGMGQSMVAEANRNTPDDKPPNIQAPNATIYCTTITTGDFSQSFCQ